MLVDDDKAKNKSLPSRERGLKLVLGELLYQLAGSLPSRERGLKSSACGAGSLRAGRSLHGSVD